MVAVHIKRYQLVESPLRKTSVRSGGIGENLLSRRRSCQAQTSPLVWWPMNRKAEMGTLKALVMQEDKQMEVLIS